MYSKGRLPTLGAVHIALTHPEDFHLAQECLEQKNSALVHFQSAYREPLMAFLLRSGASFDDACDVSNDLWTDCLATPLGARPRLHRYNGMCALQTWLNTIALNKLLTRKRHQQRWQKLMPGSVPTSEEDEHPSGRAAQAATAGPLEPEQAPLLEIMRAAVENAFLTCDAEDFVLLQLAHCDELKIRELAVMFRCDNGTISRRLERAQQGINTATMARIRARDPWLELRWADFVELCQSASPAFFDEE